MSLTPRRDSFCLKGSSLVDWPRVRLEKTLTYFLLRNPRTQMKGELGVVRQATGSTKRILKSQERIGYGARPAYAINMSSIIPSGGAPARWLEYSGGTGLLDPSRRTFQNS